MSLYREPSLYFYSVLYAGNHSALSRIIHTGMGATIVFDCLLFILRISLLHAFASSTTPTVVSTSCVGVPFDSSGTVEILSSSGQKFWPNNKTGRV